MYEALLYAGLTAEASKVLAIKTTYKAHAAIEDWCDRYDQSHPVQAACDGSILCERVGRRHKSGCLGKMETYNGLLKGGM